MLKEQAVNVQERCVQQASGPLTFTIACLQTLRKDLDMSGVEIKRVGKEKNTSSDSTATYAIASLVVGRARKCK
jgi:hypothetical protein